MVKVLRVGKMNYRKCLKLQKMLCEDIKNKREGDMVVIVEHNPVYTVGIREKWYSKEEEEKLLALGAGFERVDRGGLITFHGPGQLVAYPILDLRNYGINVRCYVKRLEDTVIDLCRRFSLDARTCEHTGVWVNDMKICALGIRVSRHVTTHGLALNCNVDLGWFSHIVPCGIRGKMVTSLTQQLKSEITAEDAYPKFRESFEKLFSTQIVDTDESETAAILKRLETHS
ncbi:UNVERIFIED_CONTAM: hypothetical protein PYX00_008481 [Menopon gallinae]|uniref:Octanoyl-[acyl-carrier-protein]:protein N-octanoyltransferase LIPT2, mitochondrial n=1 Tax=Menopon gallinae TaxID=328185 RepID=A0AAW2HPL6_9NEOP